MQLHELKPKHPRKSSKRTGRGGKKGDYTGRGIKGQGARAGGNFKPIIRGVIKRYHKLRGYNQKVPKKLVVEVNTGDLEKNFKEGEEVTPSNLVEKKVVEKKGRKIPNIKILGKGEVNKKLTVKNCKLSKSAAEKISNSGGSLDNGDENSQSSK